MMKTAAHWAYKSVVQACESGVSLASVALFSRPPQLRRLSPSGDACLVLGNGPSLAHDLRDRDDLPFGLDLICVNNFSLSALYPLLQPTYYVVADPYYWAEDVPAELAPERERFFAAARKTSWKMTFLLPFECRRSRLWREWVAQSENISVCYFNRTPIGGYAGLRHFCYRLNLGMPWAQNVLVSATFLAVNLGYKRVYLLGADHSWHEELEVGNDNIVYLRQKRFYDQETQRSPVYKGNMKELFTMQDIFEAWARVYRGYALVARYAASLGATIYNASSKSYIDTFERVRLEDHFPAASKSASLLV